MYSGNIQPSGRRRTYGRREERAKGDEKERLRLIQLGLCLALFLTVFLGKGVFPSHLQTVSGRLLSLMSSDTDFRGALARLGESLSRQDNMLGQIGEFCVEVFGPSGAEQTGLPRDNQQLQAELQFLNGSPNQAELAGHYLGYEPAVETLGDAASASGAGISESTSEPEAPIEPEEPAIPAVGTVVELVEYSGPELPDGYTMDRLSLGGLETVTPVLGTLRSGYGYREHPIDGQYKFHSGVDIGTDEGTVIHAFASGTVEYIGESEIYGLYLQIDHGQGIKSFYAHCSRLDVQSGQQVQQGQAIALAGSTGNATGPHLHFELKCAGEHLNPAYYIQYRTP